MAKPLNVSYRLKDDKAKMLKAVFDKLGFNSQNQSDNHAALIEWVYSAVQQNQNAKAVSSTLNGSSSIDVSCEMRTSRKELVRILGREGKPIYTEQTVSYCVQWERGKVKRQLKLISPAVCTICSILRAKMAEQPDVIEEPETEAPAAIPIYEAPQAVITAPAAIPAAMPAPKAAPKIWKPKAHWVPMVKSDGSKVCPFDGLFVYQWNCEGCKRDNREKFYQCTRVFMEAAAKKTAPT